MLSHYPWLKKSWQQLLQLYRKKRIPQAILFIGAQGIGASALVNAFEQLLLCRTPKNEGACGVCQACYWFNHQSHPDHLRLGENATPISIDHIREAILFLNHTSHQVGYRLITIFDADKLHLMSANALLKIVEEPPAGTIFILVAEQDNIRDTMRSRCFIHNISLPTRAQALTWLEHTGKIDARMVQWGLLLANGAPLKVQTLLQNAILDKWDRLLQYLIDQQIDDALNDKGIQQFITTSPKEALYLFYYWVTDLIRGMFLGVTELIYTQEESRKLGTLGQSITPKAALEFLGTVHEAIAAISVPSVNGSLIMESILYQWQNQCRSKA